MTQIFTPKRGRPPKGTGPRTNLKWVYCVECGKPFYVVRKRNTNVRERLHCTEKCKFAAWCVNNDNQFKKLMSRMAHRSQSRMVSELIPRQCVVCGDLFQPSHLGIHKYCSSECKVAMDNTRRRRYRAGAKTIAVSYKVVYERDGGNCQICGKKVNAKHKWPDLLSGSMDHIIPLSKGGPHEESNIQLAHLGCNLSKNNKYAGQLRLF